MGRVRRQPLTGRGGGSGRTLLLNWVYYRPVGHAIEALKVARGYADADAGLSVSVLLIAETPVELAEACPWIERAYPIDTGEVMRLGREAPCLRPVPRDWDYVVVDERVVVSPFPFSPELLAFHRAAEEYLRGRLWKGARFGPPYEAAPAYRPNAPIRFELPAEARRFARRYRHDGPKIAVLPAGSKSQSMYPTLAWWRRLVTAIRRAVPDARFYITGVSDSEDGRTSTYRYPKSAVGSVVNANPASVDCYDIGLWNQLALIELCDLLIAPHSGFAFAAPCVGTPWLEISGGPTPQCFFNDVPFLSVLPECSRYPCAFDIKRACTTRLEQDRPILCMDQRRLGRRIPDVVEGVKLLLDEGFTYEGAAARFREQVAVADVNHRRFWSFDGAIPLIEADRSRTEK